MSDWGTSSAPYLAPWKVGEADPWAREAAQAGGTGRSKVLSAGPAVPPALVAAALSIESGSTAILRRRIVTLDDRPVEVADSWYPVRIAEGTRLAESKPIKGGAVRLLTDLGYTAARYTEDVSVISLTEELAELLHLPLGDAAMELVRTSYAQDGRPIEVAAMVMTREMTPGVRRRLRYELRPA